MYTIFFQSTSVLVCSVHVLALYVCTISIVLWYMLCDGFTYFSQTVGVTSALPNKVPDWLDPGVSTIKWLYDCSHLSSGETVGFLVTTSGDLYQYFNGRSGQRVATGLPASGNLWGVADVFGKCSKIKSEMLSGKLDCVSVCTVCFGIVRHVVHM